MIRIRDITANDNYALNRKSFLIYSFSLIGSVTLFVFGIWNALDNSYLISIIEIASAGLVLLNAIIYKYKTDVFIASNVIAAVLYVVLLFLFITGGLSGDTGVFWYFTMPVVAFFLLGKFWGAFWVLILLVSTVSMYFLMPESSRIFTFDETRQLSFAVFVVSTILYVYSDVNEKIEKSLLKNKNLLLSNLEDLNFAQAEIINQKKEAEESNIELERIKSAMLNLLEDAREIEFSLQKERDRSQGIIASMGEGLLAVDVDAKITLINPVAEKLLSVKAEDVVGKLWTDIVTTQKNNDIVPEQERTFSVSLKTGKQIITDLSADHYYKTISGRVFPVVSITAPLVSDNKIIGAVKVFRDATTDKQQKELIEQKVVERTKQLDMARVKLRSSIESVRVGFVMTDESGNIVEINSAAKRILCVPENVMNTAGVIPLDVEGVLECDINTIQEKFSGVLDFVSTIKKCLDEKKPHEIKDIRLGNRFLHLFFSPIVMREDTINVIGISILVEDETEERILARSKDEFFSIASHELRTPLTAIRGNTSMLMEYFMNDIKSEDAKNMIHDIHDSSLRLIGIVNDFLDLSKLEQKKMVFKKENFDLVALVKQTIDELSQTVVEGVNLVIDNPDNSELKVNTDKDRTKEVLINLIGNAIKYTQKGEVKVSFGTNDKSTLTVFVSDTGRGIPKENQPLLFRRFQQAGNSLFTRDTTKGTGLGLYISKLMVEGMGGSIWLARSEMEQGSVFAFTIPLA